MHAGIRSYQATAGKPEDLIQATRQIARSLSQARGFVSCIILEAEVGILTMVSVFEDRTSLDEADRAVERSLHECGGRLTPASAVVARGEIVFQRGM